VTVPQGTTYTVEARIGTYPTGRSTATLHALYGNVRVTADASSMARFTDLTINLAGNYTLTFSLSGLPTIESASFLVYAGPVASMVFAVQPGDGIFDMPLTRQPVVKLLDLGGNAVLGTPWVHMAIHTSPGGQNTLSGCDKVYAQEDTGLVNFGGCFVAGTVSGAHRIVAQTVKKGDVLSSVTGAESFALVSEEFLVSGSASVLRVDAEVRRATR
jgi:hypothetical protein